jgi:flavin-dependent dehydrogenase
MALRLKQAKMVMPAMVTGNYSYHAEAMLGDRYIVIGDAFAFVDPVFSTGVHLALTSAQLGANVVDSQLNGAVDSARVAGEFEKKVRQGLSTYTWFIYRFTQPAFRNLFIAPRNWFRMEEAILSILAGDVFGASSRRFPIFLFKLIYYLSTALAPRFNLANYRIRKDSVEEKKTLDL